MLAPPRTLLLALPALAGAAGCAVLEEPPPPAPVELRAAYFPGTSLSGPLERDGGEADPWRVAWRVRELEEPPGATVPLSARTRWVVVEEGGDPLETRSALGAELTLLSPGTPVEDDADRWSEHGLAALYPGTTFVLEARPLERGRGPEPAGLGRVDFELSRLGEPESAADRPGVAGAPAELTLVLSGRARPRSDEDDEDARPAAPVARRERVLLDLPVGPAAAPARVVVPLSGTRHLLVELELAPASAAADEAGFAQAREGARELLAASAERTRESVAEQDPFELETRGALVALGKSRLRRRALVFLAGSVGAPLAGDLALVAGPEALASYHAALREAIAARDAGPDGAADLAWLLERAAYRWLARSREAGDDLAPELRGLFLRHAGELASYPDLVLEALAKCAGVDELAERLVSENRIFLEDGRPAARVRAYDWLAARGAAPEGFDPLAPRDARRAALRAAEEALRVESAAEDAAGSAAAAGEEGDR